MKPHILLENLVVNVINGKQARVKLKNLIVKPFSKQKTAKYVSILDGINLEIKAGERVALVGSNGSGKSSLLKAISGIYPYDSGTRRVKGKIMPLIEMGLGFNDELTGRENIKLGLVHAGRYGSYSKELEEKIIDFTELTDKIDTPMKNFSSGMRSRLAFAISAMHDTDILILDEVFAAGDKHITDKSQKYIKDKLDDKTILLMVNHNHDQLYDFCERGVWIDDGKVIEDGKLRDVLESYEKFCELD